MLTEIQKRELTYLCLSNNKEEAIKMLDLLTLELMGVPRDSDKSSDYYIGLMDGVQLVKNKIIGIAKKEEKRNGIKKV